MKGWYRLNALKKRFRSLLILLLSVASMRRKLIKTTNTEIQIQKDAIFYQDRKQINFISSKSFKYYPQ